MRTSTNTSADKAGKYLARLAAKVQKCRKCPLHLTRTHAVFGDGPAGAAGMLVGEAKDNGKSDAG
jgi:DNA polymerase